ncbi:MAG: 50S ribosomal protein L11 methyltransferase [Clostridia bacterium]|nr:50S ribosomal protein L11 methyltransferase [Clostridia bacterium]
MNWTQIRIKCRTEDIETVSAVMSMVDNGLMIEDATVVDSIGSIYGELIDEKILNADRAFGAVSVYIPEERSTDECVAFIESRLGDVYHETSLIRMHDEDWADSWKKYYRPVRIGHRLIVVPTWEKYEPEKDDVVLLMDPGMAFGTGTHETTRLCATLLEERFNGGRMLDVGTGSGILAIAAAKLGAESVDAYDIDPVAVRVAKENCYVNGCENINCGISDLMKGVNGEYDFICANIVADIIVRMAPDVKEHLADGGLIAFSGIINTQRDRVLENLTGYGLDLVEERTENDWVALLMKKE